MYRYIYKYIYYNRTVRELVRIRFDSRYTMLQKLLLKSMFCRINCQSLLFPLIS